MRDADTLAAHLNEQASAHTIVIDDFERATSGCASEIYRFCRLLTDGRLIILTRHLTENLRAILEACAEHAALITERGLAYTVSEVESLLAEGADHEEPGAQAIVERTNGDPLFVSLVLRDRVIDSAIPATASVFDPVEHQLIVEGNFEAALLTLHEAERRGAAPTDPTHRSQRAFIHAMQGEISHARHALHGAEHLPPKSLESKAMHAIALAAIDIESGEPRRGKERLAQIELDLNRVSMWPFALIVTARTHVAIDPVVGLEDIDRLLRIHTNRPTLPQYREKLDSAVADLALAAGNLARAKRLVERRSPSDFALRCSAARIHLSTPNYETVADLRDLIADQNPNNWTRLRAQAYFLLSLHLHRLGETGQAADALRGALGLTGTENIRLVQTLMPRNDLEVIAKHAGIELQSNVNDSNFIEAQVRPVNLTNRERHLLEHFATPALLKEIAAAEFVSLSTVKSQAASIYRKLGVSARRDAVAEARRLGILGPEN